MKGERGGNSTFRDHINGAGTANTVSKTGKSIFRGEINWTVLSFAKRIHHQGPLTRGCFNRSV